MKASDAGIALIKEFEGFRESVYKDVGGLPTIGYGHLVHVGELFGTLTEAEATALLCCDLEIAEACIEAAVDVDLQQCQFDALCALVFNIGCSNFKRSTLLQKLNRGDYIGASEEMPKWSRVGLNQVAGLLRRREAEKAMFLSA